MNLIEEAEALMLYQFKTSPKLNGLIKSLVGPFQEALDQLEELHHGRYIDEAQGSSLDVMGDILDFPRRGLSDENFRVWLKVAILLNNSHGTADGVFNILRVLFGNKPNIRIDEYAPNVVMFTFFEFPSVPIKTLFSIIRRAVPLSTNCQFVDASSGAPENAIRAVGIESDRQLPTFQLDVTRFDESIFAEFFEEEINEQK